jgi:DNA-binding CsgD family transcriptional regulator
MAIAALGMAALGKGDLVAAVRCLDSASKGLGDQDDISDILRSCSSHPIRRPAGHRLGGRRGRPPLRGLRDQLSSSGIRSQPWTAGTGGSKPAGCGSVSATSAEKADWQNWPPWWKAQERREHEIANLVARGLPNRDIAETTSLSVRTVEGHIYQASTKAGVSTRSELSALVQQFNELGVATG